jgi:hypothetical protein
MYFKVLTVVFLTAVFFFWGCVADDIPEPPPTSYVILVDYGFMVMRKDLGKSTWSGACEMCKQLRLGGFSDWRLPSQAELQIIYNERNGIGGFDTFNNIQYWSSSPHMPSFYKCLNFTNGSWGYYIDASNHQPLAFRCVRSVSP